MCAAYETTNRILVIDDDIDLLMLLERRLIQDHYEVETAVSLTEAEELIPSFLPHLVLLDINVSGEDGRKLCYKMKQIYADSIKVIIMTGYDYNQVMPVLFGADDLFVKTIAYRVPVAQDTIAPVAKNRIRPSGSEINQNE